MSERHYQSEQPYSWIIYVVGVLLVGGLAGYVLSLQSGGPATTPGAAPAASSAPPPASAPPVVDENALRAYRDILARDPKNLQAAVGAANMLYDAQRYNDAVPLYEQAFALSPGDINISTDLGTALWYSGHADEALTQYDKSLKIDPVHAQTLFNVGIVQSEGKQNPAAAIAAWEKLLASHPEYPNATHVRHLIDEARAKK